MEPVTLAVVAGAFIIAAVVAVMALGGSIGTETNFAEQLVKRRQMIEESKPKKTKERRKPKEKKGVKRDTERQSDTVSGSDVELEDSAGRELEHPHVEYEPEPDIIPEKNERQSHEKVDKVKPILRNRDETPAVRPAFAAVAEITFEHVPKDEVERKQSKSGRKDKKKEKKLKESEPLTEPVQEPVIEAIVQEKVESVESAVQATVPPQTKTKGRKAKLTEPVVDAVVEEVVTSSELAVQATNPPSSTDKQPVDQIIQASNPKSEKPLDQAAGKPIAPVEKLVSPEWNVESLLGAIEVAKLSRDDVQIIVDTMLSSQAGGQPTKKMKAAKPEPTKPEPSKLEVQLKKRLEESEKSLESEKKASQAANGRVKEVTGKLTTTERAAQIFSGQLQEVQKKFDKSEVGMKKIQAEMDKLRTATSSLEGERQNLQVQLINVEKEKSSLKSQLTDQNEVVALKASQTKLQDELSLKDQEHRRYSERNKLLEGEQMELQRKLHESSQRFENTEKQQSSLLTSNTELERNLKNVKDQLQGVQQDNETHLAEKTQMFNENQTQIEALSAELTQLKASQVNGDNGNHTANSDAEISALEEKVNSLESNLADRNSTVQSLNKQLVALKQLESKLQQSEASASDFMRQISALKSAESMKEVELQRVNEQLTELKGIEDRLKSGDVSLKAATQETLETAQNSLKVKDSDITGLNEKLSSLESVEGSLKSLEVSLKDRNSEIAKLKKDVEKSSGEVKGAEARLKEADDCMKDAEANVKKIEARVVVKDEELGKLREEVKSASESKSQVETLAGEVTKLKEKNNELRRKNRTLVENLEKSEQITPAVVTSPSKSSENEMRKLQSINSELKMQENAVRDENFQLQSRITESGASIEQKDRQISELREQLEAISSSTTQVQQQNVALHVEVDKLTELVEELKSSGESEEESPKYHQVLQQLDSMLVNLTGRIQAEEKSHKEEISRREAEISHLKIFAEQSEAEDQQAKATEMAANGHGDDSGTCV